MSNTPDGQDTKKLPRYELPDCHDYIFYGDERFFEKKINYFNCLKKENQEIVAWYVDLKAKALGRENNAFFISVWRNSIAEDIYEDFTCLEALRKAIEVDGTIKFEDFMREQRNNHAMIGNLISSEEYNHTKEALQKKLDISIQIKELRDRKTNCR